MRPYSKIEVGKMATSPEETITKIAMTVEMIEGMLVIVESGHGTGVEIETKAIIVLCKIINEIV